MHRTRTTRPVGGAILAALVVAFSLLVGALGVAAQADDTASPSASPTGTATGSTADPLSTDPTDPANPTTPTSTAPSGDPSTSQPGLVKSLLAPGPTVRPLSLPLARGKTAIRDLTPYVTCHVAPCTYARGTAPQGWPYSVTAAGLLTVKVPAKASPHGYAVSYTVTDHAGHQATGRMTVLVTLDSFNPRPGVVFSHPYRKHYRFKIQHRIVRSIDSVPPGSRIQVASWSFSSKTYRAALNRARHRGVTVQIVLAARNTGKNSDYRRLRRIFGTTVTPNGTWVKKCSHSCRGVSGTMHSKIFLFTNVYRTPDVIMTGSANLTDFAVSNQWNQMNIVVRNAPVYDEGVRIFNQMVLDRPANPMFVETAFPALTSIYYPSTGISTANDYMYKALRHVHCTGATNTGSGRTVIKIAMYAWYEQRGQWLAKQVRALWGQGCKIQIVYGISSDPVKKILYSPSGRGRIPMRQILLTNTHFEPIYYIHDKWVAIKGNYGNNTHALLGFQGSFNFSDLGFSSDENVQMLPGWSYYRSFAKDFRLLWTDRQARAPSPISKIPTIEGRFNRNDLRLGRGVYRYMEAD